MVVGGEVCDGGDGGLFIPGGRAVAARPTCTPLFRNCPCVLHSSHDSPLLNLNATPAPTAAGVLNLLYDAMPCEYISMICTEFGSLPPSSVPVILRESREDWLPSAA